MAKYCRASQHDVWMTHSLLHYFSLKKSPIIQKLKRQCKLFHCGEVVRESYFTVFLPRNNKFVYLHCLINTKTMKCHTTQPPFNYTKEVCELYLAVFLPNVFKYILGVP